jgi:hypothetical protein
MWINKSSNWPKRQTQLEKFMVEKIIQRCDSDSIISKRHRTTCGYTLVAEMIKLCDLTEDKPRTVKTLQILIKESIEPDLGQNILGDYIIDKYFSDVKSFIRTYNTNELGTISDVNISNLRKFRHILQIYYCQLEENYFNFLREEVLSISFKVTSKGFHTESKKLSTLIDLMITFLVFKGYSVSSFYEVLTRWIDTGYRITANRILSNYNFSKKQICFTHKFTSNRVDIINDFVRILEEKFAINVKDGAVSSFNEEELLGIQSQGNEFIVQYKVTTIDPHSFVRTLYDEMLKNIVVIKNRQTLSKFNQFFEYTFWRFNSKSDNTFKRVKLYEDPINVKARRNTLLLTMKKCNDHYQIDLIKNSKLPIIKDPQLTAAIYFYHLALGSKSIENSLSLLWTSLESLLPYHSTSSNIDSVKDFVGNTLSIGAISRQLQSFTYRLNTTNRSMSNKITVDRWIWNGTVLNDVELTNTFREIKKTDSTEGELISKKLRKESNLLAFEFTEFGLPLTTDKLDYLLNKISSSEKSIKYQLQRIYLHRNQIVHSGEMINEYTNLWIHLEWYIGKLLYFATLEIEILKKSKNLEDCFRKLEADSNYLKSYLEKNKETRINKLSPRIEELLFKNYWQSF